MLCFIYHFEIRILCFFQHPHRVVHIAKRMNHVKYDISNKRFEFKNVALVKKPLLRNKITQLLKSFCKLESADILRKNIKLKVFYLRF
ncbi:hypothetical protein D3C73_1209420 [compost metagenome]